MEIDFLNTFIEEANEGLELWERTTLRFELGANEAEDINTLFRIAHNLKGSALSIGLEHLGTFLHRAEEILTSLKMGRLSRSPETVTLLLDINGFLSLWISELPAQPSHSPPELNSLLTRLDSLLGTSLSPVETESLGATSENDGIFFMEDPTSQNFQVSQLDSAQLSRSTEVEVRTEGQKGASKKSSQTASAAADVSFLRVPLPRLDDLLNLIGELVVDQAIMQNHRVSRSTDTPQALRTISQMGKTIQEVQSIGMSLRMMALEGTFQKLQRTARTVAGQLEKQVTVVVEGSEVELDKVVVERLSEPLVHMVRNAVDHGAETPAERELAGKQPQATLAIRAKQHEDMVIITIEDDGRGLHADKLVQKAIKMGLVPENTQMSDEEAWGLIFQPGFSTKAAITEISGRGVGMDVVATSIRNLKGSIQVKSEPGKGTRFTLTIPLSLSIIKGLIVTIDQERYVVPLSQLVETIDTKKFREETVRGKGRVLNVRGEIIPLLNTSKILGHVSKTEKGSNSESYLGVVALNRGRKVGFSVNSILGQQSVVLKSLSKACEDLPGIIGGAILSDGLPALVLDLNEFANSWSSKNEAC